MHIKKGIFDVHGAQDNTCNGNDEDNAEHHDIMSIVTTDHITNAQAVQHENLALQDPPKFRACLVQVRLSFW